MAKLKAGDRVRIVSSEYDGHVSRMKGGTGTVTTVFNDVVQIRPDGDPYDDKWSFKFDDVVGVDADAADRSAISILVSIGLITQAQADAAQALAEAN